MATTILKRDSGSEGDPLVAVGLGLSHKLAALGQRTGSGVLARALHELLDGQDEETKELRLAMQIHLARVSNGATKATLRAGAEMLSTEEAAQLMECSRPYVAMLIDAGKLPGGVKSKGGHRKVPKASVLDWVATARTAATGGGKDYRKAAAEAGMYAVLDEAYVKAVVRSRRGAA